MQTFLHTLNKRSPEGVTVYFKLSNIRHLGKKFQIKPLFIY